MHYLSNNLNKNFFTKHLTLQSVGIKQYFNANLVITFDRITNSYVKY